MGLLCAARRVALLGPIRTRRRALTRGYACRAGCLFFVLLRAHNSLRAGLAESLVKWLERTDLYAHGIPPVTMRTLSEGLDMVSS